MTTRDPGASEVFTVGFTRNPRSTAFLAKRPAPSITVGLEVFVQEVIAAMTTSACPKSRGDGAAGLGHSATTSGVGRLLAISNSVHALVFFSVTLLPLTGDGKVSCA